MNGAAKLRTVVLSLVLVLSGCQTAPEASHSAPPSDQHDAASTADEHEEDALGHGGDGTAEADHHGDPAPEDVLHQEVTADGVTVEFTLQSFLGVGGRGGDVANEVVAGANATVVLKVSDAQTGEPLTGVRPAAWIGAAPTSTSDDQCRADVATYLSGGITARPLIDLNGYFLLALNADPNVSVIEPTIDVGGMTNLYGALQLAGPGGDWAMDHEQRHLVVTVPTTGQVAIADLDALAVLRHLDVGGVPSRVVDTPDGTTFLVGLDDPAGAGVAVVDAGAMEVVARIPTGAGRHDLAVSRDGEAVFVTNGDSSDLTVVDVQRQTVVATVDVGPGARAVATSPTTDDVFVLVGGDLVVVDGETRTVDRRVPTAPGASSVAVSPDGRWVLVTDTRVGRLLVLDATTGELQHEIAAPGAAGRIAFSGERAYVPSATTSKVTDVDLSTLDGSTPSSTTVDTVVTLTDRDGAPGPTALAPLPRGEGVYVASPAADQVALLPAGTAAPAGAFQGHGLRPRAVLTLDRSLREQAPGVLTGRFRVPAAGDFQLAVLLDEPDMVHCFTFRAEPDESAGSTATVASPQLELLSPRDPVAVGVDVPVRFRLEAADGTGPVSTIHDASAVAVHTGGTWSTRQLAESLGRGVYEVTVRFPFPGSYAVTLQSPTAGLRGLPAIHVQTRDDVRAAGGGTGRP